MYFSNPTTKAVPTLQRCVVGSESTRTKVPGSGSLEGRGERIISVGKIKRIISVGFRFNLMVQLKVRK